MNDQRCCVRSRPFKTMSESASRTAKYVHFQTFCSNPTAFVDHDACALVQQTLDGMLEALSQLTASVRSFGDNLAADFTPLQVDDLGDNSCTQNEPASPAPRMRIADEPPGNIQW